MTLFRLALKNLKRHRIRTALTILGVAIAAATLFSILSFDVGYRESLHEEVAGTGIHFFVSTEGCPLEAASLIIHGGEIPKFLQMERLNEVRSVDGVKEAAGFLIFSLPTPDCSKVDLFYGITDDVPKLKPNWKVRARRRCAAPRQASTRRAIRVCFRHFEGSSHQLPVNDTWQQIVDHHPDGDL